MTPDLNGLLLESDGFKDLHDLWDRLDQLDETLAGHRTPSRAFLDAPIENAQEKIRAFEPSVSILGQVKAGKSTLVNALICQPGLLPSDVNPWTSVITGVHLNSRHRPEGVRALFRFFDALEWDRLAQTGGRLGEIALRAGFEQEFDTIRAQVAAMRETTEGRLGAEFARLLGKSHAYASFDQDLINRYICYGAPEDLSAGATTGLYADLTKTADLYTDMPHLPRGLCLLDTPGVNDTFMMREQITLNAISESRLCVIVLSAHQALSRTDLALLRIICSIEAREVILFVNRIDELSDPAGDCARIEAGIRRSLSRSGLDEGIGILFGSGFWGNMALSGQAESLAPASEAALTSWLSARGPLPEGAALRAWIGSGVPALHRAIAARIVEGPGEALLREAKADLARITDMGEAVSQAASRRSNPAPASADADQLAAGLKAGTAEILTRLDAEIAQIRETLQIRLLRSQTSFTSAALEVLQAHIDTLGENSRWECEASSLRMALRSAFSSAAGFLRQSTDIALEDLTDNVHSLLEEKLGICNYADRVEFPELPATPSPALLARSLSLDLHSGWWKRFWRLGRKTAAAPRYQALILAETSPLIADLLKECFDSYAADLRAVLTGFAKEQSDFVAALAGSAGSQSSPQSSLAAPLLLRALSPMLSSLASPPETPQAPPERSVA